MAEWELGRTVCLGWPAGPSVLDVELIMEGPIDEVVQAANHLSPDTAVRNVVGNEYSPDISFLYHSPPNPWTSWRKMNE